MPFTLLNKTERTTAGVNVDSFAYTVPAGTHILFVTNFQANGAARGADNVSTYNNVALTYIGESQQQNGQEALAWYMRAPPAGTSYTMVVDISPEFNATTMYTTIMSWRGVGDYRGRAVAWHVNSPSPSVAVITQTNDLVLGIVQKSNATTTATPGAGETEHSDFGAAWVGSETATGTSTTISPTLSLSESWAIQAIAFKPAPGGNQALWVWFQRQQKFLQDLKRGLVPPGLLRRRYQEVYSI